MRRRTLARAKDRACEVLDREQEQIICVFSKYLQGHVHSANIVYKHSDAKRRVRNAVFMDETDCADRVKREDEIYGETDGDQIWVNPWCIGREMVLTLVHEALHDSVYVVRPTRQGKYKSLDLKQEHDAMDPLEFCM